MSLSIILRDKIQYLTSQSNITHHYNQTTNNTDEHLLLHIFCKQYSLNEIDVLNTPKLYHRYLCYRYLKYIRQLKIANNFDKNHNQTVIVELRNFDHIELIIRNVIRLLPTWRHTVVCGLQNFEKIVNMCKSIHQNINVIKLDKNNITLEDYSIMLASSWFWKQLTGKMILIYQEDSMLFHATNIKNYFKYAYVGAPWPQSLFSAKYQIGNGGFSLRNRDAMIDICNKFNIKTYAPSHMFLQRFKENKINIPPEDNFFANIVANDGKYIVPSFETAHAFSTELHNNLLSLGGHAYWLSDPNWKNRIYKYVVKRMYCQSTLTMYEHRYGWSDILKKLYFNDIITLDPSQYIFIDIVEHYFPINKAITQQWIGVVHYPPIIPNDTPNLHTILFNNPTFIESQQYCLGLVCLSNYSFNFCKKNVTNVPVFFAYHPICSTNIKFNMQKYLHNKNKHIIQVGNMFRNISSIYKINVTSHSKLFLPGTRNFERIKQQMFNENPAIECNSIQMLYVTNTEYDNYLSENILFTHVNDASANNTVLEAIAYKTPLIINKHPAVVEYLGNAYPLYFNTLSEINDNFIHPDKIANTHKYLQSLNTDKLLFDNFKYKLLSILY